MNTSAAIVDVQASGTGLVARGDSEGMSFLSPRTPRPRPGFYGISRRIVMNNVG